MAFDPVTALLGIADVAVKRIWPDPEKQAQEQYRLAQLAQNGDLAVLDAEVKSLLGQLEINKTEAQHKSVFVAGWRPFVGWSCGVALAYAAIIEPFARFICVATGVDAELPQVDSTITMQALFGMLGLGAYRMREKEKGVASDSLKSS